MDTSRTADRSNQPVDADNHYYESLDAFTRHQEREFAARGVQVMKNGRRTHVVVGGKVHRFIPNPTFDPVVVPGCLDLMFRGQVPEGVSKAELQQLEPLSACYQNRDARLAKLDEQGLRAVVMFPTLGCGIEEALRFDVPATMASLRAFNRWLEEDWGFSHLDRIISAPMISLADPAAAVAEVERVIALGARVVHVRPAPVPTGGAKGRSLGDRLHDPVWATLAGAGVPVAFHLGDSGYQLLTAAWGGAEEFDPFRGFDPLDRLVVSDRAIHDTIGSLVVHGVFTRHPELKVASIENGSDWVHTLLKRLRKLANQNAASFAEDPLDTIRRHLWITPYYEEDLRRLADTIGVDRVLFGSDWPHGEGLAEPVSFTDELSAFDPAEVDMIMRKNCAELVGLPV